MDLGLAGRTVFCCGTGSVLSACLEVLALEGASGTDRPERADIVLAAAARRSVTDLLAVDDADLLHAWGDVTRAVDAYRAALPTMLDKAWGRLVWIGSAQALSVDAEDDELAAIATLGVLGLHKVVTAEAAPGGVTANAVLRGGPATDDDVAAAAAFLCSAGAAYLSGVALTIDGGRGSGMF